MVAMLEANYPACTAERLLQTLLDTRTKLDLETLKHLEGTASAILAFVRSEINNYASVNALPAEVLGMIFQHALLSERHSLRFSGCAEPPVAEELRSRIVLTHVCQRWRQVALHMASLWTVVNEFSPDSTAAFLARSGDMPLQVYVKKTFCRYAGQTLVSQGTRIRELRLSIPRERRTIIPSNGPEFPFDASNLERLCIVTESRSFDESRPNINLDMLPVLFPGPTPHLKNLVLRNMCWLPAVSYESITHLHVTQGTPISLVTLLIFLGRCTALEELVLEDIYIASSTAVPLDHAIALPHLRTLVLGINQSHLSMRRLLQYLLLPATATLHVHGVYAFRALSDLRPFPQLPLAATFDTLSIDHAFGHLLVRASGPSSALLLDLREDSIVPPEHAVYLLHSLVPLDRIADLRYRSHAPHRARRALHLLADTPMPALRTFAYVDAGWDTGARTVPPEAWREAHLHALAGALARAPNLGELQVWSADADFQHLLAPLVHVGPALRTVVLHCSGIGESGMAEALQEEAREARVCKCRWPMCEPPLVIPGVDPGANRIYEW